nr:MAG TPA: hypothetical protein [Caudoviricetes sp.]
MGYIIFNTFVVLLLFEIIVYFILKINLLVLKTKNERLRKLLLNNIKELCEPEGSYEKICKIYLEKINEV